MTGGTVSTTPMVSVQKDLLPQQSCACHVMKMVSLHSPVLFVTMLKIVTGTLVVPDVFVQQLSVAVGGVITHAVPHWNNWLLLQRMTGGTLSTMVTVWLQLVELPQQSVMIQSRVMMSGQFGAGLVTVLPMTMVGATVQQSSNAVGGVKFHGVPQLTVILDAQMTFGGSVSTMNNLCVQTSEVLVQQSVAVHMRS